MSFRHYGLTLKRLLKILWKFAKLAFETHESTELGLLRVRKNLLRELMRRYEARKAGF